LQHILQQKAEALLEDLAAGRLTGASGLCPEERSALERYLRPQPQRAAWLRERMKAEGALLPRHAWPQLALIATWQGGSAPFYLAQLTGIWPDCPRRCLGLRASEGIFSIPLADNTPAGVLAVGSHVMEFLPAEAEVQPQAETLLAHELEKGRRYRLIITTSAGFCRYDLADIIEVVGFCRATPEIAFLHKAGSVLSITGEKVTEDQVVLAMREVERDFSEVKGFTVTLELLMPPRYILAVELAAAAEEVAAGAESKAFFRWRQILSAFEHHLCRLNPEYAEKRASSRLAPPRLLILASGSYLAYRAACAAAGRPDSQIKPPHLVPPSGPGQAPVKGCPFFDRVRLIASCASEK
ncbi:MAG: GH3 auxin-responsive promoter family protein, partial [Planctomycetota bacterium]|nr:GH3 auxin-responsive promoter family protein [Planctomycetota bacterium]